MISTEGSDGRAAPLAARDEALIRDLAAGLTPVRRLHPPARRVAAWLGAVGIGMLIMLPFFDWREVMPRVTASPDAWLAIVGSALTAVAAAIATVRLGLPDASRVWALLPLPFAALWLGASGIGCMRVVPLAGGPTLAGAQDSGDCFFFIVGVSVPLALILAMILRRSYTLHPLLLTQMAGLACAAASATLLVLIHPFQISWLDLGMHALAVALVMLAAWAAGMPMLRRTFSDDAM
ncbi:MAG: NrsF family protein [Xanthobacteraceae bacterium]